MRTDGALHPLGIPAPVAPDRLDPSAPGDVTALASRLGNLVSELSPAARQAVSELFDVWLAVGGPEGVDLLGLVDVLTRYWRLDELAKRPSPARADVERITDWDRPSPGALEVLGLPQMDEPPPASLWEVMYRRRSGRDFAPAGVTVEGVGTLLRRAAGATAMAREAYGIENVPRRAYPTAGGLHGVSTYLYAQSVEGLDEGIYRFIPLARGVELLGVCDVRWKLAQVSPPSEWAWDAPVTVALVGDLRKLTWKYGRRSYRLLHVEAGALLENLCLAATALGWNACPLATVDEDRVRWDLGFADGDHVVTCLVAMGRPPEVGA